MQKYSSLASEQATQDRTPNGKDENPSPKLAEQRQNAWTVFARLGRVILLPGLAMPVLWATTLAWWSQGTVDFAIMSLSLIFSFSIGIGLSLLDYVKDFQQAKRIDGAVGGVPSAAWPDPGAVDGSAGNGSASSGSSAQTQLSEPATLPLWMDGYECIRQGRVSAGTVRSIGYVVLAIGVMSNILLGMLCDWPVWFFGVVSLGLLILYLQPVIRYRPYLWVLGDVGLLVGLGLLPGLIAYYGQTEAISRTALISIFLPAVLTWLSFQSYNLYTQHRDWKLRRRTAVVSLGPQRALDVAAAVGLLGFGAPLLLVALNLLPPWSLLSLGALPTFLRAFARGHHQSIDRQQALQTVTVSAFATALAGVLMIAALWLAI